MGKTKSDDFPNWLEFEFDAKSKMTSAAMSLIELEIELEKLHLKGVKDFCNGKVSVLDKYEVTKMDHKLCMLVVHKNHDMSYAQLILDKLKSTSPLIICVTAYLRFNDSQRAGIDDMPSKRRFNLLLLTVKESRENTGTAARFTESKPRNARNTMGSCLVVAIMATVMENTSNGGLGNMSNFCGLKVLKKEGCFKKFPEKTLAWYKEKTTKAKASSSMEVSLASLDPEKLDIDIMTLQGKGNDALAILHQDNMWICDTGASTHVMWSYKDVRNV